MHRRCRYYDDVCCDPRAGNAECVEQQIKMGRITWDLSIEIVWSISGNFVRTGLDQHSSVIDLIRYAVTYRYFRALSIFMNSNYADWRKDRILKSIDSWPS